jgi:2-methylcitrate dehydratase PrpD
MVRYPLTRELARFVSQLRDGDLPARAREIARAAFADTLGVMIAGAHEAAPALLAATLAPSSGDCDLLFGAARASAPDAAWINATAAHALDFDDAAQRTHPSAVLVPAIIAEAQSLGADGKRMELAYVAGFEAIAELAGRDTDQQVRKGWHPTGVFGTVGARVATRTGCAQNRERARASRVTKRRTRREFR